VREVVAVDPSKEMLKHPDARAESSGSTTSSPVQGSWQDVANPTVDVALCSYVLPIIEDAGRFLAKLDAACRERAFVYMCAMSADAFVDPLWRHFHGKPRRPGPTYLDAVDVLRELGMKPEVEVIEVSLRPRFKNLATAVADYHQSLLLPDEADVRRELRELLRGWLVEDAAELRVPLQSLPAAVISWPGGGC
jgi:hypothetical protein